MLKKCFTLFVAGIMILSSATVTFASGGDCSTKEKVTVTRPYSIDFDDSALDGAAIISSETNEENGRLITITKYRTPNGNVITDTFERSSIMMLSKNGTDTATRKRDLGSYGVISVTASFKWYTNPNVGPIGTSYVKCTKMSAKRTGGKSFVKTGTWKKSYSSKYKSFGKAYAKLKYYLYNGKNKVQHQSGTVKITCSDSGTISDNF